LQGNRLTLPATFNSQSTSRGLPRRH
jgi:hypothetical protein